MASRWSKPIWILLTLVVVGFTAYMVGRNLIHIGKTLGEIRRLRNEAAAYRTQIEADSTLIEQLRYDDYLEAYAREHFGMQRRNEKVYILKDE